MASLITKANKGHFGGVEKKNHWKLDWYSPSQFDAANNDNSSTEISHSTDNSSSKKYQFSYKAWQRTNKSFFEENEADDIGDLFDLSMHAGMDNVNVMNKDGIRIPSGGSRDDGLTVEDIRGAVGDSGAIPGLSSSDTTKNDVKPSCTEQPAASVSDSTTEPVITSTTTEKNIEPVETEANQESAETEPNQESAETEPNQESAETEPNKEPVETERISETESKEDVPPMSTNEEKDADGDVAMP